MGWRLFLDDDADTTRRPAISVEDRQWRHDRNLPSVIPSTDHLGPWVLARSCEEAIHEIDARGLPNFVSFDHDLCDEREGYDGKKVAEYIVNRDRIDRSLPSDFAYEVHSWNGRGAIRIESFLESYLSNRHDAPAVSADDLADMNRYYETLFGS
jgi:hypothetical protein